VISKICTKCNQLKSLSEFYKSKNGKYGRHSICKMCANEAKKARNSKKKKNIILNRVPDLVGEIWKDISDYEGKYQVSNFGRVKGLNRYRTTKHIDGKQIGYIQKESLKSQKKLKPKRTRNDDSCYLQVTLCKDGKVRTLSVHRLVAEEFLPNPDNKPYVNHKDGNRANNNVKNLEWTTNSENQEHAVFNINNGLNPKPIIAYDKKTMNVESEHPSMTIAAKWLLANGRTKDKTCLTGIIKCCKGTIPSYLGYVWRYKEVVK